MLRLIMSPKKMVGFSPASTGVLPVQRLNTASGVGRSADKITVAPTESGNVRPFPRPYAKNNLAAENKTSDSEIPSTALPNNSAV